MWSLPEAVYKQGHSIMTVNVVSSCDAEQVAFPANYTQIPSVMYNSFICSSRLPVGNLIFA